MSHEFLDYVEDILDAMKKAEILLEGVTYDQFESDFRINFAVVRALEIIGEAALGGFSWFCLSPKGYPRAMMPITITRTGSITKTYTLGFGPALILNQLKTPSWQSRPSMI